MNMNMNIMIYQGVVFDSHDGVVREVNKGDVHKVGKCPIWKKALDDDDDDLIII